MRRIVSDILRHLICFGQFERKWDYKTSLEQSTDYKVLRKSSKTNRIHDDDDVTDIHFFVSLVANTKLAPNKYLLNN